MHEATDPQHFGHGWHQVNLWCRDWQTAEHTAVHRLGPRLADAERAGILTGWWFTRKNTCWRVRYQLCPGQDEQTRTCVEEMLRDLAADCAIERWAASIYEPKIHAFGGVHGMEVAHELFRADSRHLLDHLRHAGDRHRSELGVLLACALLRSAAQDWYEQGDIWAQVAAHRTVDQPSNTDTNSIHQLLTGRAASGVCALAWSAAFEHAGATLAELAHEGRLTRGLRAVLAHHILFAWNRAGTPAYQQAALAAAAREVVFGSAPARNLTCTPTTPRPATLRPVTHDTAIPDPTPLRAALVDHIRRLGTFHTPAVEAAFSRVPRHVFLPEVDLHTAYAPQVVVTKRADDGTALSSASSPNVVATMLEQLNVQPGHRVLEIGAGTGINAALLAELVGTGGEVVTVEIDDDLVTAARHSLATAGYQHVAALRADGADGHAAGAPYDRIIVTAEARDIAPAWWGQLAPAGRLVVPLRLHDGSGLTRSIAFDHHRDQMVSDSAKVCGFVPLQGAAAAHTKRSLQLADDVTLNLASDEVADTAALGQALTHSAHEVWTGIMVGDDDPVQHLDLWLATAASGFARLSVGREARQNGQVTPALRWAGATLHDGASTLVYLTARSVSDLTDELGVIAHGPEAAAFAARTIELLHRWSTEQPTQPAITAYPAGTPDDQLENGYRVERPHTRLTIRW